MVLELVWLVLGLREVLATMALTTSSTTNTTNSNSSISSIALLALRGAPGVSKVLRWSYKAAFTVFCLSYCVPRKKTHVTKSTCVPAKRRFAPWSSLWDENKIFGAMVSILPCKLCDVQCKMCFGQHNVALIWFEFSKKKRSAQYSKILLGLSSIRGQRKLFQWKKPNDFPVDFRKMFPKTH